MAIVYIYNISRPSLIRIQHFHFFFFFNQVIKRWQLKHVKSKHFDWILLRTKNWACKLSSCPISIVGRQVRWNTPLRSLTMLPADDTSPRSYMPARNSNLEQTQYNSSTTRNWVKLRGLCSTARVSSWPQPDLNDTQRAQIYPSPTYTVRYNVAIQPLQAHYTRYIYRYIVFFITDISF